MRYEIWLLLPLAAVFIASLLLHRNYLKNLDNKLRNMAGCSYDLDSLKKALQIGQGPNFSTIMLSTWCLFFVSLFVLYFLTPTIFPELNYFQLSQLASQWWGIMIFGMVISAIVGVFSFFMTEYSFPWIYQYYDISRTKKSIMATWIFILLLICVSLSFYLAVIYPDINYSIWNMAYAALFASQILLILPLISANLEGKT